MKFFQLIFILIISSLIFSCSKSNDFDYPAGTVSSSKIIYFPAITTIGEKFIILNEGDSYTDEGANATLNSESVDYTTDVTVNTAVPGVYNVIYSAVNAQGYSATDWRTVVVIGNDVKANNFSGTYLRAATGITSTWTKIGDGIYTVENPGGSSGVGLTVTLVNYEGSSIAIPRQISADFGGEVSSEQETYNAGTVSYIFHAGGYGTSLRTFTKQ